MPIAELASSASEESFTFVMISTRAVNSNRNEVFRMTVVWQTGGFAYFQRDFYFFMPKPALTRQQSSSNWWTITTNDHASKGSNPSFLSLIFLFVSDSNYVTIFVPKYSSKGDTSKEYVTNNLDRYLSFFILQTFQQQTSSRYLPFARGTKW